jgi:hypothetical protein
MSKDKYIQERIEEFERMTPDNIPSQNDSLFGKDGVTEWLKTHDKEHLFSNEVYGEPMCDLDKDKIIAFLRTALSEAWEEAQKETRLSTLREVEGVLPSETNNTDESWRTNSYDDALEQNKITTGQIWFGILLVLLLIGGYYFADQITSEKETETTKEIVKEVINEVVLKKPSCPDTSEGFAELKADGQIVPLAEKLNSYGAKGDFINKKFTVVKVSGAGSQIACGYLYVKAHVGDSKALQLEWEHPYIKPGQYGGHIITSGSIIPASENETELLFNLSKIQYRVLNSDKEIRSADWSALLNVSNRTDFEIALNTSDKTGMLDEVLVAYKCWNPETGLVTNDCKLSVE